jgi:dienelactone hydrolase
MILTTFLLLCQPLVAQQRQTPPDSSSPLEKGKLVPHVTCSAHPEQSYALYLPSNYSPDRKWPLLLSSDPLARGSTPLELQKSAAEQFGFILAASNNSRNGPGQARFDATEATLNDVRARVSIDPHRVYLAGFSGGARFSSQIALACQCSAGVFLDGAGFSNGQSLATDQPFPVFSAIGILDFNYCEVIPLQDALEKSGYPHWLRVFNGAHEWALAEVMEEAMIWFRIESMKAGREPRDPSFLDAQFARMQERAHSFEQSGDLLATWREYRQVAATFDALKDITALRARADALGKEKAVREALKHEQSDFAEQTELTSDITSHLDSSKLDADDRFESDRDLRDQIARLRMNAQREKRPERARVYKRALDGLFIGTFEMGDAALDSKNSSYAVRLFDVCTQAKPDSEWAWRELAVAYALAGKNKDALAALRKARDLTADKLAFAKWLSSEPAFANLQAAPEFGQLTNAT